jgi:membrane fusion protein, multidrug efflux system
MTAMFFSRHTLTSLAALALALAASSVTSACSRASAATKVEAGAPFEVEAGVVASARVPRHLVLTGTLVANQEAEIAADGSGKVVASFVERGDAMRAGAVLMRLDARTQAFQSAEARASTRAMLAEKRTAELDCERAQRLFAANVISRAELDRTSGSCDQNTHSVAASLARADIAAKALSDTVVRAPFDGVVAERTASVGEYVVPGTKVVTLVDTKTLRLELTVPESALAHVREGAAVEFSVAAQPGRRFNGVVQHVGPVVRKNSRDQIIEAVVANDDGALRPGMFALAELSVGEDELPVVPESAIGGSKESPRVFVVNAGRIEERVVLVGEKRDRRAALKKGVRAGETIVTQITPEIRDGARVASKAVLASGVGAPRAARP